MADIQISVEGQDAVAATEELSQLKSVQQNWFENRQQKTKLRYEYLTEFSLHIILKIF